MVNITTVRNAFAKIFGVVSTIINITVFVCQRIISPQREDNSMVCATTQQGIIDMNRNGNFCAGTWVSKVIAKAKVGARVEQQKKFTGFSRMSVT